MPNQPRPWTDVRGLAALGGKARRRDLLGFRPVKTRMSRLRRILLSLLVVGVLAQGLYWWAVWLPTPPVVVPDPGTPQLQGPRRATLGGSVLEERAGYWFFLHTGDPVRNGAEHARLGGFMTQRAEDFMMGDFQDRLPLPLQVLLPGVLMWQYRRMPHHVAPPLMEELYGYARTYDDRHRYPLDSFRRGLYYHALHDITQALVGNPWVAPGVAGACTAFGAAGEGTTDGHTIVGRNFDFEVVPLFDSEKVVHLYVREGAIPVLSVSWMGMTGVLTGMNAEGVYISVNSAASEGSNREGPPMSLWVREILEQAHDLDDVERLLQERDPIISDIYLAADGKSGRVSVFERGETRLARRDLVDGKIVASNHFITDTYAGDEADAAMRKHTTTLARYLRMAEVVAEQPLSVLRGQEILRDRKGPGGMDLPLGHRNAIDALIASHSVVADATDRVLWVSTAPHTQGPWRAIDLLGELEAAGIDASAWRQTLPSGARAWERIEEDRVGAPPGDLPEGDLLRDGGWERLVRYRSYLSDAEHYLAHDRPDLALNMVARADALQPGAHDVYWLRGEAHRQAGREDAARAAWTRYLESYPDFGPRYFHVIRWFEERGGAPTVERADTRSEP